MTYDQLQVSENTMEITEDSSDSSGRTLRSGVLMNDNEVDKIISEKVVEIVRNYPCIWDPQRLDGPRRREAWQDVCKTLFPSYDTFDESQQGQLFKKTRGKWIGYIAHCENKVKRALQQSQDGSCNSTTILSRTITTKTRFEELVSFLSTKQHAKENDIFVQYGKYLKQTTVSSGAISPNGNDTSFNYVDEKKLIEYIEFHRPIWDIQQNNQSSQPANEAWNTVVRQVYPNYDLVSADTQQTLLNKVKTIWYNIYYSEQANLKRVKEGLRPIRHAHTESLTFLYKNLFSPNAKPPEKNNGTEARTVVSVQKPEIRFIEFDERILKQNMNKRTPWNTNEEERSNLSFVSVHGIKAKHEMDIGEEAITFQRSTQLQATNVPAFDLAPVNLLGNQGVFNPSNVFERVDPDETAVFALMQDYRALSAKQKIKFKIHTLQFFMKAQEERDRVKMAQSSQ